MRAFKVITDPEAFELLGDETRRRIVYLLRANERTVSQIAEELKLTPQAIYHHIRKMRDAGLVEVGREERVDHFIETYYRATAEVFHFSHGKATPAAMAEAKAKAALDALSKVGIRVASNPETVAKLVEIERKIETMGSKEELMNRVAELEDVDFFTKQEAAEFAKLISMTDKEYTEYLELWKALRRLLRAELVETVKT